MRSGSGGGEDWEETREGRQTAELEKEREQAEKLWGAPREQHLPGLRFSSRLQVPVPTSLVVTCATEV